MNADLHRHSDFGFRVSDLPIPSSSLDEASPATIAPMIKFACAGCGERLSVPNQHGGRKAACPTCQAVNRVPLRGYAETQPNTPSVARAYVQQSTSLASAPPVELRAEAPAPPPEPATDAAPASPALLLTTEVTPSPERDAAPERVPIVTNPRARRSLPNERSLPRGVKIALLVFAALAVVGALYLGLYFALRFAVPGS